VAHFIKEKEDNQSDTVRFRNLRYQTEQKAVQLALLKRNQPSYCKRIVGIDAAASEFDTPPEVFAPAFRYLKRNGFKHFTYHAGEDFYHILGGLRAIYEAIDFCGLSNGDRIGHGVATGISTKLWTERIGKTLLMRQGDYLDDLLFARHLITTEKNQNTDFVALIPLINSKISTLSWQIYKENVSVDTLDIVWKLRKYSPAILCGQHSDQLNELLEILKVLNIAANEIRCTDERIRLLCMYHQREHRQKCNKIIEVETEEFFSTDQLTLLQLIMLDFMHRKEIVIETLPSSNVRVGVHCNFDTYHLWNWYQWKKQGHPIPPIVIGTDDAGIFATNIYNEYANVYCNLTVTHKVSHDDAMNIIKQIDENSRIYRFENYTTYTKNEKE
ncbi:MAG: hypothetical protein LBR34_06810, partial [Prevotella sp.]|nr:hypothetical protein [Prevotella sp.]